MAQQWNYNYWQTNPYGVYYDFSQPAQTYDYNHKTLPTASEQSSTPPPPGLESKIANSTADTANSSSNISWSNSETMSPHPTGTVYSFPSNPYAQAPRPSMVFPYDQNRPVQPIGYQGYNVPQYPFPTQNTWNSPGFNYGYPPTGPWQVPNGVVRPNDGMRAGLGVGNLGHPGATFGNTPSDMPVTPTPESIKESLQKPPESLQAKGTKEQWTDELKDYVQRAFSSIDTSEEKDQMERILKEKLEYIFRNNIQIDWTTENIPTIPSRAIAGLRNSFGSRPNAVNVLRPVQLPGPRGIRATGPARGTLTRLPVGILPRGGRNIFSNSSVGHKLPKKRSPSKSRSRSRSPAPYRAYSHRSRSPVRSSSSNSSDSRRSSSGENTQTKRRRRRIVRSRSNSVHSPPRNGFKENEPSPQVPTRGGRKNRRRKRGGATAPDSNTDDVSSTPLDTQSSKSRGRGGWRGKRGGPAANAPKTSEYRLSQRANRFKDHLSESVVSSGSIARTTSQLIMTYSDDRDDLIADLESCQIVGTMQEIEKPYLRLTRAPDPSEVRPSSVLKLSLEHVRNKIKSNADYHWVCEQFKSIRQDLTVQGIEDDFTVSVYEAHADAALDAGDFEEFHQCQSQLLRLHKEGLGVSRLLEFTAYRLLYYIFTLDILGINTIMAGLRPSHRSNPCIEFALKVRSAWSLNNYHRFFRLVCPPEDGKQPPLRCKNVVNWFLERERKEATKIIFKVFRPTISLSFVADILGFTNVDECKDFICKEFSVSSDALIPVEKIDGKVLWGLMCQSN